MAKKKKIKIPNYRVDIFWSSEDECFIANVPELESCTTDGDSREEAAKNAEEAIAVTVESMVAQGMDPPLPISEQKFSGKITVRTEPAIHRKMAMAASSERKSLNKFIVDAIEKKLKLG